MMRRAKVNYLDKEDMMGHNVGLQRHYERYKEEDFERFSEYQKAILLLTISEEEQLKIKNQQLEDESIHLKKSLEENQLQTDEIIRQRQLIDNLLYRISQLEQEKTQK